MAGSSGSGKNDVIIADGLFTIASIWQSSHVNTELVGAAKAVAVEARRSCGYIFQARNLHSSLTAQENVMMGLEVHGAYSRSERRNLAVKMLAVVSKLRKSCLNQNYKPRLPERKLASQTADGEIAKCKLIEANLRFVVAISKRYRKRNVDLLDLIQEGSIGLDKGGRKVCAQQRISALNLCVLVDSTSNYPHSCSPFSNHSPSRAYY